MQDLFIFIGVMVLLFIMWLSIGGYNREEADKKFIDRETLEVYDEDIVIPEPIERIQERLQHNES